MAYKIVVMVIHMQEQEELLSSSSVPASTADQALEIYLRAVSAAASPPKMALANTLLVRCLEPHQFAPEEPMVACVLEARHVDLHHKAPDGRRWE